MQLSDDGIAIVLVCSHLALPKAETRPKPFSDLEWSRVAEKIASSEWRRPARILGKSALELEGTLGIERSLAERIARLTDRGGQLAIELERLASLGIWVLTRADADYPKSLKRRLRGRAPAVFFGMGQVELVSRPGVAIVGSRELDGGSQRFSFDTGKNSALANLTVFSGASRGADISSMKGALAAGGTSVGVLSDGLERSLTDRSTRDYVLGRSLTLISPFHPSISFRAANAMARNKLIYCLSRFAIVIASSERTGGTWAGAIENLKSRWVPLFVRVSPESPAGNALLLKEGARPLPSDPSSRQEVFIQWLREQAAHDGLEGRTNESPSDLFPVVWATLEAYLDTPRTERELANHFGLESSQARAWIVRALTSNSLVQVDGDPPRYRVRDQKPQQFEQPVLLSEEDAGHYAHLLINRFKALVREGSGFEGPHDAKEGFSFGWWPARYVANIDAPATGDAGASARVIFRMQGGPLLREWTLHSSGHWEESSQGRVVDSGADISLDSYTIAKSLFDWIQKQQAEPHTESR